MRIAPIERPRSLLMKLAYRLTKRQYGKVISPLKVIYARRPRLMFFGKKILDIEKKIKLDRNDKLLIRNYISHLNHCSFCSDLARYEAARHDLANQKIIELLNFRQSEQFSEKEKSLLTYVDEVATLKNASDETFARLRSHYTDEQIIDITWISATEHYFNLLARPLGVGSDGLSR